MFYRSGGGSPTNRVPMGEAFMMTHSFAVEKLEDAYADRVREYAEGNETLLAICREKVRRRRGRVTGGGEVPILCMAVVV